MVENEVGTAYAVDLRNVDAGDVVVLGAGFSKAVDSSFPITDELGHQAIALAGMPPVSRFQGGNFEAWLSFLAEPQPFFSHARNLANQADFARLVDASDQVLCNIENSLIEAPSPTRIRTSRVRQT